MGRRSSTTFGTIRPISAASPRLCNGAWVGDGSARELQQADGTYRQISLGEWKMMKHLVKSKDPSTEGKTPAELALVSDLQSLSKQRTQEKKGALRNSSKSTSSDTDEPE